MTDVKENIRKVHEKISSARTLSDVVDAIGAPDRTVVSTRPKAPGDKVKRFKTALMYETRWPDFLLVAQEMEDGTLELAFAPKNPTSET